MKYAIVLTMSFIAIFVTGVSVPVPEREEPKEIIVEAAESVPASEPAEPETEAETEPETEAETEPEQMTIYGKKLDPEIVEYFREELAKNGIDWWMPYAIAQAFQESGFNPVAENKNGLDKGLLQFRIPFWESVCAEYGESGEWQDWKLQIRIYCKRVAKGLNDGKSIENVISDHNTGGCGFNEVYVRDVLRHLPNIKEERK